MTRSIATILPLRTVKPAIANGLPRGPTTTPAAPLTIAGRPCGANREPRANTSWATASAPVIGGRASGWPGPASSRNINVGIEQLEQRVEVPGTGRREERVHELLLAVQVGVGLGVRAPDAPTCPACQLAGRRRRAIDNRRDLLERDPEHVVKNVCKPLRRRQRLEHDEQREPNGVRQHGLLLGPGGLICGEDRLRQPAPDVFLAARGAASEHVERDPADDGRQPAGEVVHRIRVAAPQAQPALLDRVVRLADRAEHPIGDRVQSCSILFELARLPSRRRSLSHLLCRQAS